MVVNLYYSNPNVLPAHGFGYLIPRSTNNPEHALGVMFASEASMGQDTAPGTKITVMLGGHYWDGWTEADYPDHDEAETLATLLLERHLGIKEAPTLTRTRLQRNAIPQYTVGHEARIREISRSVRADFRNRLTLAGNWYYGVGLVDCITQAYLAASYGVGHFEYIPGGSGHESLDHVQDCEGGVALPPTRYFEIPRQDIS